MDLRVANIQNHSLVDVSRAIISRVLFHKRDLSSGFCFFLPLTLGFHVSDRHLEKSSDTFTPLFPTFYSLQVFSIIKNGQRAKKHIILQYLILKNIKKATYILHMQ